MKMLQVEASSKENMKTVMEKRFRCKKDVKRMFKKTSGEQECKKKEPNLVFRKSQRS